MNRKKEIFTEDAKRLFGITPYSVRNYSNFKDGSLTSAYEWFKESWSYDEETKEFLEIENVDSEFADKGVLATLKSEAIYNKQYEQDKDNGRTVISLVKRLFIEGKETWMGAFEQHRDYIYFDLEGTPERVTFDDGKPIPKDFLKEIEENKEWLGGVGIGKQRTDWD